MPLAHVLANAGLFQLGWFACVLGAQRPWLLLVAVACLLVHLLWIAPTRGEWRLVALTMLAGWLLDSALLNLGLFDFGAAGRHGSGTSVRRPGTHQESGWPCILIRVRGRGLRITRTRPAAPDESGW